MNEETFWFNQVLLEHKDKTEGTDSYLSISAVATSQDLVNIGKTFFAIRISGTLSKSCLMSIHQVRDLVLGFREIYNRTPDEIFSNENKVDLNRRFQKGQDLLFKFRKNQNGYQVVKILIKNSETDFSAIVISREIFESILWNLSYFRDNYIHFISMFKNEMLQKKLREEMKIHFRGLYSAIESSRTIPDSIPDSRAPSPEPSEDKWSESTIDELDNFLGKDMENIKVPEIEKAQEDVKKEKSHDINSKLFEVLEGDLKNFEPYVGNRSNILEFEEEFKNLVGFEILPGINDDDLKSLAYMSTLYYQITLNSHTMKKTPIPPGFPTYKYSPSECSDNNINLAADLMITHWFYRTLRRNLENSITDSFENYSIFHMKLRSFTDPMVYSFLDSVDKDRTKNIIINRYKKLKDMGFFKSYIEKYDAVEFNGLDEFINQVFDAVSKIQDIHEFHDSSFKGQSGLKLPAKNSLNLEQIINEVVPTEVNMRLGNPVGLENLNEEVKSVFNGKEKKQKKLNPIQVFANQFKTEFPEGIIDDVLSYLESYGEKKLNLKEFPFELKDIEENALKGLYFWNPDKHKNASDIKRDLDDPMTKDLIIAQVYSDSNSTDEEGDEMTSAISELI